MNIYNNECSIYNIICIQGETHKCHLKGTFNKKKLFLSAARVHREKLLTLIRHFVTRVNVMTHELV